MPQGGGVVTGGGDAGDEDLGVQLQRLIRQRQVGPARGENLFPLFSV